MVGWNLPLLVSVSHSCNAHARSRIPQDPEYGKTSQPRLGGLGEGAPSLRLGFEDLPLVQGDQEGSKRLRPKSRVGRIRLVGWDPIRLLPYVPQYPCNTHTRFR